MKVASQSDSRPLGKGRRVNDDWINESEVASVRFVTERKGVYRVMGALLTISHHLCTQADKHHLNGAATITHSFPSNSEMRRVLCASFSDSDFYQWCNPIKEVSAWV